ncbi:mechanosensitive ion channel family protein [Pyruvatibacter mobilis]|uniref:mechanosensitive ion channel family protein n=1 Tax=Pyruvatibacter mobilis TaxID=1712261 RepID=UPI003BACD270
MYQPAPESPAAPDLPDLAEAAADAKPLVEKALVEKALAWLRDEVLTVDVAIEAGLLALIAVIAILAGRRLAPVIASAAMRLAGRSWLRTRVERIGALAGPVMALVLTWGAGTAVRAAGRDPVLLTIAGSLLIAWVLIRLITALTRQTGLTQLAGLVIWAVAALAIVGWLEAFIQALDAAAFTAGGMRISLLTIVNGILLISLLLWAAITLARVLETQLGRVDGVTPAARVLVGKVVRIALLTIAVLVGLTSIGIDFTAVAVFSGAIGVGIGFGLQKVVSNLISGMILLLDRSIKPGDVIEIGEAYGWISKLGARYAAIVTRDGKEYLIPNEDLITQQVVNWSFSDRAVRLKTGVGVSYQSDVRKALDLMMEAAQENDRVLKAPPPATRLIGFGDNSVDLELRIWVNDPEAGVVNVASDIRLTIWDKFHAEGIEFPFPQRDLHITAADGLRDTMRDVIKEMRDDSAAPHS